MLALEARESCLQETRRHHGHGETRATGVASSSGDDRPAPMPPESDLPPAGLTP